MTCRACRGEGCFGDGVRALADWRFLVCTPAGWGARVGREEVEAEVWERVRRGDMVREIFEDGEVVG